MINDVVTVNGVNIHPFQSFDDLLEYVSGKKGILVAINADKILHATEQTRDIINRNIGYCDGIGAVIALKKHGYKDAVKIPGCELWLKIIASIYKAGKTFYFVGSKQEVIDITVAKLKEEFPGIEIVNYRNGYINSDKEKQSLLNDIAIKKPDVVFVAMGSPKQELLMEEMFKRHPAIYQGLGGSFDVYTGNVRRAPEWWRRHNLEGAYRLLENPKKIGRFVKALPFWWKLLINKL